MSLSDAFNATLQLVARDATIARPGVVTAVTIKLASSNYFRHLAGPEGVTMEGREYVISKKSLDAVAFPTPRRGDQLQDSLLGKASITEVREMMGLGGEVLGFRVRVA